MVNLRAEFYDTTIFPILVDMLKTPCSEHDFADATIEDTDYRDAYILGGIPALVQSLRGLITSYREEHWESPDEEFTGEEFRAMSIAATERAIHILECLAEPSDA